MGRKCSSDQAACRTPAAYNHTVSLVMPTVSMQSHYTCTESLYLFSQPFVHQQNAAALHAGQSLWQERTVTSQVCSQADAVRQQEQQKPDDSLSASATTGHLELTQQSEVSIHNSKSHISGADWHLFYSGVSPPPLHLWAHANVVQQLCPCPCLCGICLLMSVSHTPSV